MGRISQAAQLIFAAIVWRIRCDWKLLIIRRLRDPASRGHKREAYAFIFSGQPISPWSCHQRLHRHVTFYQMRTARSIRITQVATAHLPHSRPARRSSIRRCCSERTLRESAEPTERAVRTLEAPARHHGGLVPQDPRRSAAQLLRGSGLLGPNLR